jgi:hypothetical protein
MTGELTPTQRAKLKVAQGQVQIRYKEDGGRPYVHTGPPDTDLGGWAGPFKDEDEAQAYIDAGSFEQGYAPGHAPLKVGHRVKFLGVAKGHYPGHDERDKSSHVRCHTGQRLIAPGETAVVIKDNGFDYRFTYRMESDGLLVRPGNGKWERIFDDEDDSEYPVGTEIAFMHESGVAVNGLVVGDGVGPHGPHYLSIYISPNELARHGLVREKRHSMEGMTRQVPRKWIINDTNGG